MAATTFSFRNEFLGLVIPASRLASILSQPIPRVTLVTVEKKDWVGDEAPMTMTTTTRSLVLGGGLLETEVKEEVGPSEPAGIVCQNQPEESQFQKTVSPRAVRAARRGEKSALDDFCDADFEWLLKKESKSLMLIQHDWKNTLECQATRTRFWDNYAKLEKLYKAHAEHSKIQDNLQRDIWAAERACRLVADLINEEETPTKEQFEALEFAQGVHKELLTQAKVLDMQARDIENDIQKVTLDQLTTQRRLGELGINNTVPPAIHKQNRERYLSRVKPKRAAKENKNIVQAPNQNQMEAGLVV